jgi:hypothetical protein
MLDEPADAGAQSQLVRQHSPLQRYDPWLLGSQPNAELEVEEAWHERKTGVDASSECKQTREDRHTPVLAPEDLGRERMLIRLFPVRKLHDVRLAGIGHSQPCSGLYMNLFGTGSPRFRYLQNHCDKV